MCINSLNDFSFVNENQDIKLLTLLGREMVLFEYNDWVSAPCKLLMGTSLHLIKSEAMAIFLKLTKIIRVYSKNSFLFNSGDFIFIDDLMVFGLDFCCTEYYC